MGIPVILSRAADLFKTLNSMILYDRKLLDGEAMQVILEAFQEVQNDARKGEREMCARVCETFSANLVAKAIRERNGLIDGGDEQEKAAILP